MEELRPVFIIAGVLLEVVGIFNAFRGKSSGLELIILGILCLLVGLLI
ncbi:hypothetical protein GCM10007416_17630 [Kroppenstedtia guangzhouensis]|jgi:hypothetical protein|uniref:Uncharacterized protein n=1 Tax=Kroppenstedtia guangzhouensis TaxID=1274356 RepID=A0ABQ1GJ98_9BACL|nr:hypothetical protein [Kroppenstedtia guangzhouensis]GGA45001.1 hypothetical protein GCM10007416_17630 [Kroppenstedtia guangzhouensis]